MSEDAKRRDDEQRLIEQIAQCMREAERLGLHKVAIDLDAAIHKVRGSPSRTHR